jgi:hypothetical protein
VASAAAAATIRHACLQLGDISHTDGVLSVPIENC